MAVTNQMVAPRYAKALLEAAQRCSYTSFRGFGY